MGHGPGSHPEDEQAYQEAVADQNQALLTHSETMSEENQELRNTITALSRALRMLGMKVDDGTCFCHPPMHGVNREHELPHSERCRVANSALALVGMPECPICKSNDRVELAKPANEFDQIYGFAYVCRNAHKGITFHSGANYFNL